MKIERGVVSYNNHNEMIECSPRHIYKLNYNDFNTKSISDEQNVLGVIIHDKFSICREFIITTGHYIFGFIINKGDLPNQFWIQSISGFNHKTFNPFDANYSLGQDGIIEINELIIRS